jgi:multidrug transporter EmrE-like cation transporter
MAYTIGGFVLCAWYGPSQDAEDAFWPLIRHHYNPWFQLYAVISYGTSIFYLLAQSDRSPLRFMLPPKGSVALTVVACAISGMLAGLLQLQLKLLAQTLKIVIEGHPKVACASAPWPGYCRLHVKSEGPSVCPAIAEVYAWDVICLAQTHLFHRTIPAWPAHWLHHVSGWCMVPSALMQLNILNFALESNDMAVTVPWWSSMVLVFTIMAGLVYFEESSSMGSPPLFFLGALISLGGLVVVAQEKGRKEQAERDREKLLKAEELQLTSCEGGAPSTSDGEQQSV